MPTLLQVDHLTRFYGEKILFRDISFVINQGQKIALIAKNGTGKTSLLNVIAGLEPSDNGSVTLFNSATYSYLKQEPDLDPGKTIFDEVYSSENAIQQAIHDYEKAILEDDKRKLQDAMTRMDALNGWEYETRIRQILTELRLEDLLQKTGKLSGGQRKRVALAKTLIHEPDFLILDEPTNHLDLEMIEWLEEFLLQRHITLFMVTHDRYFLDRVCDEILELDNGNLFRYKGNFSYFLEKQAERIDNQNKETERARNLMRKEQDWMNRMPKARTTKSKARIDSFYDLKAIAENKIRENRLQINIEGSRMGKKILEIKDISFSFGENRIVDHFSYVFRRREKVGLVGVNGSGKTTFLNLITHQLKPQSGRVDTGGTIKYGYYRQEGIIFNEDQRVIDVVRDIAEEVPLGNGDTVSAATFLNYFMFPYHTHYQQVRTLSGGEKRRLYLVTVLMQNPNFLILDEPTNDLDIFTLTILEEFLSTFDGCVIIVTHDRFFLDKIVDHLFIFEGKGMIRDFPGNYTQFRANTEYLKREEIRRAKALSSAVEPETASAKPVVPANKLSYKEKKEIEQLETDISSLEKEKSEIEQELQTGNLSAADLHKRSARFGEILALVEEKTLRWMELSEKF
ncbi:MAG: ABC-F family ATP-binding cassette domain-containing protein [Syntrophothermus sp.]